MADDASPHKSSCFRYRCCSGDTSHSQWAATVKESILELLKKADAPGVLEAIEILHAMTKFVKPHLPISESEDDDKEEEFKSAKACVLDYVFGRDVQALLIESLVRVEESPDSNFVRRKAMKLFQDFLETEDPDESLNPYETIETVTGETEFTEAEIRHLVKVWSTCTDEKLLDCYCFLLQKIWFSDGYRTLLLHHFMSILPVKSAADARLYLPLAIKFIRFNEDDWLKATLFKMPNLLPTILRATAYLTNCWRLLSTSDLVVEKRWIEARLWSMLECLFSVAGMLLLFTNRCELFMQAGFSRFLRCFFYAFVETHAQWDDLFGKVAHAFKYFLGSLLKYERSIVYNLLTAMSPKELRRHRELLNEKSDLIPAIDRFLQYEDQLQPLSRADAEILLLPNHVKEALDSMPVDDLLFDPTVGCWSLLLGSRHHLPETAITKPLFKCLHRKTKRAGITIDVCCCNDHLCCNLMFDDKN